MRIVVAANWWYRRGGLGTVMLDEASALEARGHHVIPFASAHPDNLPVATARFFPPFTETADGGRSLSIRGRVAALRDLVDDRHAARCFEALIDQTAPDIVHVHNTVRQLSPSMLRVAQRRRLPIVMTLHDFGLVCPQGLLLRGGHVPCDPPLCVTGSVVNAVRHRCVKGSAASSVAAAIEMGAHRRSGAYEGSVDVFLAPSRFLAREIGKRGGFGDRIRYLPNGIASAPAPQTPASASRTIVSVGRLVPEKGIDVLIQAARLAPALHLVVAGDGPDADRLRRLAPQSVRFVGQQTPAEISRLLATSRACVLPSIVFENAPISVIEAMRAGRPVIGTQLGGIPELLEGGAGIVVRAADPEALARAMVDLVADPAGADAMGARGRRSFERRFTLDRHVDGLLAVYAELVGLSAA